MKLNGSDIINLHIHLVGSVKFRKIEGTINLVCNKKAFYKICTLKRCLNKFFENQNGK